MAVTHAQPEAHVSDHTLHEVEDTGNSWLTGLKLCLLKVIQDDGVYGQGSQVLYNSLYYAPNGG